MNPDIDIAYAPAGEKLMGGPLLWRDLEISSKD